jgi:seryl-tRNA synthetase
VSKHEDVLRRLSAEMLMVTDGDSDAAQAIDAVLAEVESLRAERDRLLEAQLQRVPALPSGLMDENRELRQRAERLETALRDVEAQSEDALSALMALVNYSKGVDNSRVGNVEISIKAIQRQAREALAPSAPDEKR